MFSFKKCWLINGNGVFNCRESIERQEIKYKNFFKKLFCKLEINKMNNNVNVIGIIFSIL